MHERSAFAGGDMRYRVSVVRMPRLKCDVSDCPRGKVHGCSAFAGDDMCCRGSVVRMPRLLASLIVRAERCMDALGSQAVTCVAG